MPVWVWVLIAIAVVAVLGVVVWQALARRRTSRLQRAVRPRIRPHGRHGRDQARRRERTAGARGAADAARDPAAVAGGARSVRAELAGVQAQFVDDPGGAVAERRQPDPVGDGRARLPGRGLRAARRRRLRRPPAGRRELPARASARPGERRRHDSTESLRQAMRHYRALFEELVEADAEQPLQREQSEDVPVADRELGQRTDAWLGEGRGPFPKPSTSTGTGIPPPVVVAAVVVGVVDVVTLTTAPPEAETAYHLAPKFELAWPVT